jgi:nucleoside-diphosphate-sugar epimerase
LKILVTGAAGDIGSYLVPALLRQGHTVRALVKDLKEADRARRRGVEIFIGDIADPRTLNGAAYSVDAVYHLAAAFFVVNAEEALRIINYEGTINVANECIEKGVKRFIFPSFPLVLGPHVTPSPPLGIESAKGITTSFHALYKRLCEQHLHVLNEQGKLSTTILRLGTVYGPDIRLITMLKKFLQAGLYRIPGSGNNLSHFAHVEDVVQGMLLALSNERAAGQVYNVADDKPVRFKDFVYELADLLGAPRPGSAPVWLFKGFASLATAWAAINKTTPIINRDILNFSLSSFAADTAKTRDELGFRPTYPTIYDGLPTCVDTHPENERSRVG